MRPALSVICPAICKSGVGNLLAGQEPVLTISNFARDITSGRDWTGASPETARDAFVVAGKRTLCARKGFLDVRLIRAVVQAARGVSMVAGIDGGNAAPLGRFSARAWAWQERVAFCYRLGYPRPFHLVAAADLLSVCPRAIRNRLGTLLLEPRKCCQTVAHPVEGPGLSYAGMALRYRNRISMITTRLRQVWRASAMINARATLLLGAVERLDQYFSKSAIVGTPI